MGFCIERAIVVNRPLAAMAVGNHIYKYRFVCITLVVALFVYSILIVGSGIERVSWEATNSTTKSAKMCVVLEKWFTTIEWFMLVDIAFSIFLPFVVILITNLMISVKLMQKSRSISRYHSTASSRTAPPVAINGEVIDLRRASLVTQHDVSLMEQASANVRKFSQFLYGANNTIVQLLDRKQKSYMRTTRLLLLISTTFLILNTPLVISKVRYFYLNSLSASSETSDSAHLSSVNEKIFERVSCDLFYLNFAVNFLLYTFNRATWRGFFIKKWFRC
jgi:hypothetical protein